MTLETDLAAASALDADESSQTRRAADTGGRHLCEDAAQVFAGIAPALVPLACEAYTVVLERTGADAVRIECGTGTRAAAASVVIPISASAAAGGRGYSGTLTLHLGDRHSSAESGLAGRLAVELANAIVERERLRSRTANLELALESNREIGAAIGVVMMTYKCTSDQAFNRLRRASQQRHRKLAAIAQEVTRTGLLDGDPSYLATGSTTT